MSIADFLLGLLGIVILIFVFGPAVVGAFDLGCYFLTTKQCTSIAWNDWRLAWAILPTALIFFGFVLGAP